MEKTRGKDLPTHDTQTQHTKHSEEDKQEMNFISVDEVVIKEMTIKLEEPKPRGDNTKVKLRREIVLPEKSNDLNISKRNSDDSTNKKIQKLKNIMDNNTKTSTPEQTSNSEDKPINLIKKIKDSEGGSLWSDIRKVYKFKEEVLGDGHFGIVRVCYKRDEKPRKYYAVKSITKKNINENDLKQMMKEVHLLATLDHPNIIKFHESYHDELYFHILMELCTGKEVFDRIIEEGNISENKVSNIICKVTSAIAYAHSMGVSHRDLKPENILFEADEKNSEIKLIDFGLSKKYTNEAEKMNTILGTPYYVAPEVLKGEYDNKCDVWSIGAITYIMLSGEPPFSATNNTELFNKIIHQEIRFDAPQWSEISEYAKDFIKKCMVKDPNKRFTSREALEHAWFNKVKKEINSTEHVCPYALKNLKSFSHPQKFKKLILKCILNTLSIDEMKRLRRIFQAIDLDHTGYITRTELEKAFDTANIDISMDEITKIIDKCDEQKNGMLNYTEFLVATLDSTTFVNRKRLETAFKYFDIDDSGCICANDLHKALLRNGTNTLDKEELDKMIREVSADNKENIKFEEFLNLFGEKK